MIYRHTQVGWTILAAVGLVLLLLFRLPRSPVSPAMTMLLVAVLVFFGTLTVTVDKEQIEARFGPGLIRFRISVDSIQSCRVVRNPWLAGWGIRWIGSGWLFNVSGLDAVELTLKNAHVYRIGTDEPEML